MTTADGLEGSVIMDNRLKLIHLNNTFPYKHADFCFTTLTDGLKSFQLPVYYCDAFIQVGLIPTRPVTIITFGR